MSEVDEVFTLPGLRVLAISIRDEVITQFTAKADTLQMASVVSLATERLLDWERWARQLDHRSG